ncbi:MAG: NAD(P)/FAD-dependent oxidoreductase [Ruminococcaceae bacterium]|nr:NAD(P)/FAD-dependent oxidoreductase [Oscillospiraceae bacterium]
MVDVCIIGGGAAGLMAAGTAAERGLKTIILERNEKVARKVMITGKGRCNVTNYCTLLDDLIRNIPVNGRFLFSAFSKFMPVDTMDFFEEMGVPLKVERGNRVFPESDKASDIVDALRRYALRSGAEIITGRAEEILTSDGAVTGVKTYDGDVIEAKSVIVATGGKSYPLTGSTGDGYILAEKTGHTIVEQKPSLVPLEVHEGWCSSVMGLSLRNIEIRVEDTEKYKCVYKDFGEMLFTHFGVSGPVILSASSHMKDIKKGKYEIYIDLKPALDEDKLDKRIQRDFLENSNKNFINALDALLPKKLVPIIVKLSGIKPSQKVNQITRAERENLVYLLKNLKLTVNGFRPIEEAIVTSGGVSVKDISPKNMMSKKVNNLFFAGEVIDVDAYTGGFNLQIAFSTGRLAGKSALSE